MPDSRRPPDAAGWIDPARQVRIRESLAAWAEHVLDQEGLAPAAHHRHLLSALESVSTGDRDRVMVLMPPGSAKSTYTSIIFPPWWFVRHPRSSVIAASHTAHLATHFGRRTRALIRANRPYLTYGLNADERAAGRFCTTLGGEYLAAGVIGPIVGRRADLVIIDDPVRSLKDADSATRREEVWNWFRADLMTRLRPGGRIVLVMTRWHEDDLGGRILAREESDWHIIRLPALAEAGDPLGRAPGEPLWPEHENAEALARKRASVGERVWSAQFQQDPHPPEGSFFATAQIATLGADASPQGPAVRGWDLAATAAEAGGNPDWTVGLKLMRDPGGRFVVTDVVRLRGSPMTVEQTVTDVARADGPAVRIGLPQDPGSAGKAWTSVLTARLAGFNVTSSPETGSKMTRANGVASQIEAGNLMIVPAKWNAAFLDELKTFPHGGKDDQVDALSRAFALLAEGNARPARREQISIFGR